MKSSLGTKSGIDLRTKLLVMLALVSLPLLVLSLFQLHNYQRDLKEQAITIARIKTAAAEGALESWLQTRPQAFSQANAGGQHVAADLYTWLHQHASPLSDAAIVVYDAQGRIIPNPAAPMLTIAPLNLSSTVGEQTWSDGVARITGATRAAGSGWSVVVGVPLPEQTPAGRSMLILTATWALTLLASSLLSVWAVKRLTKPLTQLAATATTLGAGRLQERATIETDDEVGTLAAGFNEMAASLERQFGELREQGAFIEEVLNSLPLGVAVLDDHLIISKANAAFAGFIGREGQTLSARGLYEAAAGLAALSDVIEDVRRSRRSFVNYGLPLELTPRPADEPNTKFWDVILWPTSERGDVILILSEVSKRVRAERLATAAFAAEKVRAAELESVINQMEEGVIIVDARGRYRVNPAAARIIGRPPGEFRDGVQASIADMALRDLQGNLLLAAETPLGRALERGEHVSGEHVQIIRGNGKKEEGVLAVSATPLVGDDGRHEGVVAVFRDITMEVTQYRDLMDAYSRLREHDRLKSAFVANVSHELRTPLNVIIGLCQLLERDRRLPLAPLQTEVVGRMERNARTLLELVNDLLDYSRLEAGRSALHLEEIEVLSVIDAVIEDYAGDAAEKQIRLFADVLPDMPRVRTDRHRLEQVLSNLISNAVKFTPAGEIRISAGPLDREHWFLEVSDTGIGISTDALDFIFEEFRQVDDRLTRLYNGVGLGLAITRKIVELLEGEIKVESALNSGSRFHITWPLAAHSRTGTGSLVLPPDTQTAARPLASNPLRVRAG
ncbi:MAG: ATP-binding protein [Acidobacteriota bacterium]|nr:ATP-binding protein [Acidobacteriota bacterium]